MAMPSPQAVPVSTHPHHPVLRTITPVPFKAHKLGHLSAELLEQHFEQGYGGAVQHLNDVRTRLAGMDLSTLAPADIRQIKHDEILATSDAELHRLYFHSLGDQSEANRELPPVGELSRALEASFGSIEQWRTEFVTLAKSLNTGPGWVLLAWSDADQCLMNVLLDAQAPFCSAITPVLAIDLHAHAYQTDFDSDLAAYIKAFLDSIHWGRVSDVLAGASADKSTAGNNSMASDPVPQSIDVSGPQSIDVNELKQLLDDPDKAPLVLDVRHEDDRERYRKRILETSWRDSFNVASWQADLPGDRPVIVYCMYGFWVSQDVAAELRKQGYDARTLQGGVLSWSAMGFPTTDIEALGTL